MSDAPLYTVSLKGASAQQPWVVVNASDAGELDQALDDLTEDLLQKVADLNALYQGVANVANPQTSGATGTRNKSAAGAGEPAQETQSETKAPARQRGGNAGGSTYGRKKAAAGSGGRGGKKPKLTYEEASADCDHGERRRYTKPDVDWVLYGCPLDKNDPNNCGANFVDKSDDGEE